MKLRRFFLPLFLFSFPLFCLSQEYSLNDFIVSEIPKMDTKEWYDFNRATNKEFVFTVKSGKIQVSKYKYVPHTLFNIPIGKLIGINMGEFGGGLYFNAKDSTKTFFVNGKNADDIKPRFFGGLMIPEKNPVAEIIKDSKLIQSGNVQFIFKFKDSICFMGGVAHMGLNYGNLYKLKYKDNSFFISKGLSLGDAPSAMCIYEDTLYVAGNKGFYMIDKDWNIKTVFDDLFWDGLYPTSVVVLDKKNIFVTIRGGYVKINPEKKKISLYKAK